MSQLANQANIGAGRRAEAVGIDTPGKVMQLEQRRLFKIKAEQILAPVSHVYGLEDLGRLENND